MHFRSPTYVAMAFAQALYVVADEVHLVNCYGSDTTGVVIYCANGVNCDSTVPSSSDLCTKSTGSNFVWEGAYDTCTFSTDVTFAWDLNSGVATYAYAGSASNGFETFSCYRDSDPAMAYSPNGAGDTCYSIYYCLSN